MKRLLYCIFISGLFIASGLAQTPDTLAKRAQEYYDTEQYEKAIDTYKSIITAGYESPEVYYNLGNAYFKSNKIPYAILNYERAKKLAPNNEDINYNLELSRTFVVDQIEKLPEIFYVRWKKSIHYLMGYNQWAVLSLILFISTLMAAGLYLFSRNLGVKKSSFILGVVFLLVSVYAFVVAHARYNEITSNDAAIIINPTVTIKGSPDVSGTDLFILHEGTKVNINDQLGEWREIRLSDGNKGWIKFENLVII